MEILNTLKHKSDAQKARYAFFGALSGTLIIALFWVTALPSRFAQYAENAPTSEDAESGEGFTALFEESKSQLGSVIEGSGEILEGEDDAFMVEENNEPNAFDAISMDQYATATVATSTEEVTIVATGTVPLVAGTTTAIVAATSTPIVEPRVILIATTSSQKQE